MSYLSHLLDEEATCRSCDEALEAYQRMKIATYHERLRVYMETCLKNCRVPTWDEWLEVLLNTNQEEQ